MYRAQVEDAVYHLFSWTHGTFTFEADLRPSQRDTLISVSADSLLLEGARRVDEWTQIAKKIPSLDLIFEADTGQKYVLRGGFVTGPAELDGDRAQLKIAADSCDRM